MGFSLQSGSNTQNSPGAMCDQILGAVLATSQNDYTPSPGGNVSAETANTFELNCIAASSLTGVAFGKAGRQLRIVNIGAATITILAENAGSVAANRFNFAATVAPGQVLLLQYSMSLNRWCAQNTPGATAAAVGANPTAQVGLAAVNGVAATFLRSDGAPALDQAIAPTWTGTHTFGNATTALQLVSTAPRILWNDTNGAANAKITDAIQDGSTWSLRTRTDADGAGNTAISMVRGGTTVNNLNFAAAQTSFFTGAQENVRIPGFSSVGCVVNKQIDIFDSLPFSYLDLMSLRVDGNNNENIIESNIYKIKINPALVQAATFEPTGSVTFNQYGAGALTTDASGNITAVSDVRLKRNIRPFDKGLETLALLPRPILHGYTLESGLDQTKDDYVSVPLDAAFEAILPESVGRMKVVTARTLKAEAQSRQNAYDVLLQAHTLAMTAYENAKTQYDADVIVFNAAMELYQPLHQQFLIDMEVYQVALITHRVKVAAGIAGDESPPLEPVEPVRPIEPVEPRSPQRPQRPAFKAEDYDVAYDPDPPRTLSDRALLMLLMNCVRELAQERGLIPKDSLWTRFSNWLTGT